MDSRDAKPGAGTVPVPGAELRYVVEGEGRPCLVIGSSVYYPRTFSQGLRRHLELAFADLRHFATSDGSVPLDQITLDTYADDIDRLRRAVGHDRVAVMGHSMHGTLALEYARRYPQHVSHVIAICAPPVGFAPLMGASAAFFEADASAERKRVLQGNIDRLGPDEYARISAVPDRDALIRLYLTNGPMYWYDPTYDAAWLWADMRGDPKVFGRVAGLLATYDLGQGPGEIEAPVLVATGRHDYVVPHTLWRGAEEKIGDLTVRLFEKSGHTPQLEEAAAFDRALLDWFDKH